MPDTPARTLIPGRRYNVAIKDCCVAGSFEAVLDAATYYGDDPDDVDITCWSNGVTLTEHMGVRMMPIALPEGELTSAATDSRE